ncbi:ANTAR domain-containing protein [Dermatobacter hominis]|uniref:ANTAR domain-containing protein n=1 Tax=Dermatobacter hominis TaxID=2884263 RepID=UPI001D0FDDB8|nr:ANTAR domain-containing protein [Dermatobacter hominis]UDY34964.1 ANTAR domain-containing protein [Dermatobacter hominis]
MTAEWVRIASAFAVHAANSDGALCAVCADLIEVSGAGITILDGLAAGPVCSSDARMRVLEDLQFTLGEGPARDAHVGGTAVRAPRLDDGAAERWPVFVQMAEELGVAAVFAFPLHLGAARVGVLSLYHHEDGSLTAAQDADVDALVEVLTATILAMVRGDSLAAALDGAVGGRSEIHQATGMVAAQLGVGPDEAIARIRAHAYATDETVDAVAAMIVMRHLRLSDDQDRGGPDG